MSQETVHVPKLRVPRTHARERIVNRVEIGKSLFSTYVDHRPLANGSFFISQELFNRIKSDFILWNSGNRTLISELFTTAFFTNDYDNLVRDILTNVIQRDFDDFRYRMPLAAPDQEYTIHKFCNYLFLQVIDFMSSLAVRLDLVEVADEIPSSNSSIAVPRSSSDDAEARRRVFVVHGRDEETKAVVARFLEHCQLVPIVLHEQADRGRSIIEKFEQHSDVQFAVVLLTPDDVGGLNPKASNEALQVQPRARQNVVMELGYFIAKLGRRNVCALKKGDLELPSDYTGIIYTPFGPNEGWKLKLARELKAAGLEIDLNTILID